MIVCIYARPLLLFSWAGKWTKYFLKSTCFNNFHFSKGIFQVCYILYYIYIVVEDVQFFPLMSLKYLAVVFAFHCQTLAKISIFCFLTFNAWKLQACLSMCYVFLNTSHWRVKNRFWQKHQVANFDEVNQTRYFKSCCNSKLCCITRPLKAVRMIVSIT